MNTDEFLYALEEDLEFEDEPGKALFSTGTLTMGMVFLTIITLLAFLFMRWMMDPATLPIRSVRVEGEFRQLAPDLLRSSVINVVRDGFFKVDVALIQRVLHTNPWVAGVTVRRVWPDGLVVQVLEKQAIARWGDAGLVSPDAELFIPDAGTIPTYLPRFFGPENTHSLILNRYLQIDEILDKQGLQVDGVTLDQRWSWSFRLEDGPEVLLGRREVTSRIERFSAIAATELGEKLHEIDVIDMRYTNGIAIRWKKLQAEKIEPGLNNHG